MIIECERCHTKFNLDENLLKEAGSKVRCSICKNVFTAFPPKAGPEIEEVFTEKAEHTGVTPPEEIPKEEDLISDVDKALAEEVGEEEEEIETISFDDIAGLEEGPVGGEEEEEEKVDIDEAMDRAAKVEEEIISKKELEGEEEEEVVKPRQIIKKRRRSGLWVAILIVIFLIAGAASALIMFKPDLLPEYIPLFKKPLSKEQAFDMGNKRLSFRDLKSSFANSEKAGKLFVVKGLVTNNYPDKRNFIKIRSSILNSKGKVITSKITFAGTTISDNELQSLSMEEINNLHGNKFGKNNMNINILPKSSIPFVIIFSDLPEDISEFTVEAISSFPAKKETLLESLNRAINIA